MVVVAGGAVGPVPGTRVASSWWGLLRAQPVDPGRDPWPGLLLFAGVAALAGTWLLLVRRVRDGDIGSRTLWWVGAGWALPLAVGPPVLSGDVFSYAAQGIMQLRGLSPYRLGPAALGAGPALASVDPRWRHAVSPYGPVAAFVERLAAWLGGTEVGTALVLRVVAVAGVVAIGTLAQRLAPPHLRLGALALTVANPLLLLQGLSAAHFEVLLGVAVLASLLAAARGRPCLAVVLACVAGAVKFPGMVPALLVGLAVVARAPAAGADPGETGGRRPGLAVVGVTAAGVASWLVLSHLLGDGWGWLRGLRTPGAGMTPLAPTQLLAGALGWPLAHLHLVSEAAVTSASRLAGVAAAVGVAAWLLGTHRRRSMPATAGAVLLAGAVLAPVVYPWYLLWGVLCLAPVVAGPARGWLVGLCAVGSVMNVPGMPPHLIASVGIGVGILALGAGALGLRSLRRDPLAGPGCDQPSRVVRGRHGRQRGGATTGGGASA